MNKQINENRNNKLLTALFSLLFGVFVVGLTTVNAAVGDVVKVLGDADDPLPFPGADTFCSVGLAFDGTNLYYDRCGDPNIYTIDPNNASLVSTFNTTGLISSFPNAMAFDATRNGTWFGVQACDATGMPIYFWDFDDGSVTLVFHVPFGLLNPATNASFLGFCFLDGLAFNANGAGALDDELFFSDDVNENLGVFRPNGTFVTGFNASTVNSSLATLSGLAVGGSNLYMANDGGGDVFRASLPGLVLVDQFASGDDRQEDMECDPETFGPTEVMWVRTTPQGNTTNDLITAYEIEAGTCATGGGGEPEPEPIEGRMTGGGSVANTSVRHGFELHCDATELPNRLEVNWGKGNKFHLESLTLAVCTDDPNIAPNPPVAGFDTYKGNGTGRYNGVSGATAKWLFTDAGEPGKNDSVTITVWDVNNTVVLNVTGLLKVGNHQAHAA